MKKQLFFIIFLNGFVSLYGVRQAQAPEFEMGHVKMSTRIGLCGGITFVSNADVLVRIRAYRFAQNWFGSQVKPGKPLSEWIEIPEGGLRAGYDWAGARPSVHYRVYCQAMNPQGVWLPVDCAKVIRLEDVQHNRPCVWGPAGPSASYTPLNMKAKAKPVTVK